jgi:hypothetical protein
MLKKTITYEDFNGNTRTEDFYFNLTRAEIAEMELSTPGGLTQLLEKIVSTVDTKAISELFKDLILRSYGEKSPDGKRFIKNQELRDGFSQTNAYSDLFLELASGSESATAFVNGIIPTVLPT